MVYKTKYLLLCIGIMNWLLIGDENTVTDNNTAAATEEIVKILNENKHAIDTMLAIVNTLVKQMQDLFIKIQSIPHLTDSITKWGESKAIVNWQEGADWSSFKKDADLFVHKLILAKELDPYTKKYRHIAYIIENADLSDTLNQLQQAFTTEIPLIVIPENIEKITPETKKALQTAIAQLADALYNHSILQLLDEIFAKYEPTAQKMREEEEASEKQAALLSSS